MVEAEPRPDRIPMSEAQKPAKRPAWRDIIVSLNNLGIGDLDGIRRRIDEARIQVRACGQTELADKLDEAWASLARGEFSEYRRLLSLVVSRLGHLKD
jgi:hypothetical protein